MKKYIEKCMLWLYKAINKFLSGEYVRATFAADTRYTFLVNSSRVHDVPVINGKYQCIG